MEFGESFPLSPMFCNHSDPFFKQSLSSEITARTWQFPFLVQPQVQIILIAWICSCFNSQKMGVTTFMRKNHCYRQSYISIYDFFSFHLWYAYQSNTMYTILLKFPPSSGENTWVNAAFCEQMLSLSKGSGFDTQLCLTENDILYRMTLRSKQSPVHCSYKLLRV